MIIVIDIGNTSISLALVDKIKVRRHLSLLTGGKPSKVMPQLRAFLRGIKGKHPVKDIVICSVVPVQLKLIEREIKRLFKKSAVVAGRDIRVPMRNNYRDPRQVGQDRLVGAFAAKTLYGAPVIIIDFGTAITFDVVNARGEYDGGIIVPGIRLSAESLFKKTALLPEVSTFNVPRDIVGKNTKDSILSGLFYGYAALCNGLVESLQKRSAKKAKVVITGGHTEIMKKFISKNISHIDNHLVFKGISLVYDENETR